MIPACGSGGFLLHTMDHILKQASQFFTEDTPEHYAHWHNFAEKRLFGIEVNDSIARVAKMNMIIHDDGHSNVIGNDALIHFDILNNQHRDFKKETFDLILTNPPFGAVVKKEESPYLDDYNLSKGKASQKTEILFLERCFDFLKWEDRKTGNHFARWDSEQFVSAICSRLHRATFPDPSHCLIAADRFLSLRCGGEAVHSVSAEVF